MADVWRAGGYHIEYKESVVDGSLLWESHCHASFEVIAVLQGDITLALEGNRYRLSAGECALISPLAYHTVAANRQGCYRRITALFDPSAVPAPLLRRLLGEEKPLFVFRFFGADTLREAYLSSDRAFFVPLAESVMTALLYEAEKSGGIGAEPIDVELSRILSFIDAHLCEPIALDAIAADAALSKSSVCHLFAEKMGISPKQYILRKKLALAEKYIGEGMAPTSAAMVVGYEDYSNFYRAFLRHFGVSPSKKKNKSENV